MIAAASVTVHVVQTVSVEVMAHPLAVRDPEAALRFLCRGLGHIGIVPRVGFPAEDRWGYRA